MIFKNKTALVLVMLASLMATGCFRYSFTGTSIPENVNSVYIPFFADQSSSGIGNLSDRLNDALVERFINQTRLQLANSEASADAVLEGSITSYRNGPFSVTGEDETSLNEVTIGISATFKYTSEEQSEWSKSFSGSATYDINENPIDGETNAAAEALGRVADNMFNDAVSGW
ncbi:LPS assembly lipoprotein LptE [Fodinibius sediminis]|uniref:Lipopolysaccharide-assembly n=1 Tax=Fodinibius sediminis TaxID=1214077 RepID=A0A521DB68_9BACT|nr:LptE family protein [Fodinibius sediminis]SMO68852.1 Lipopolysaccharide-assembly [Fodinibius sediminis]